MRSMVTKGPALGAPARCQQVLPHRVTFYRAASFSDLKGPPGLTAAFDPGPRPRAAPFRLCQAQASFLPRSHGYGGAGQRWR